MLIIYYNLKINIYNQYFKILKENHIKPKMQSKYQPKDSKIPPKSTTTSPPIQTLESNPEKSKITNYIKDEETLRVLKNKGIIRLLPIQYETYDIIYGGGDIVAKDRTGSGKTIAFSLPVITRMRKQGKFKGYPYPKFLVILPTRELAIQVAQEMESIRHKNVDDFIVTAVYGGAGIQEQLRALSKGADIIVGTPGRLIDFIARKAIRLDYLQVICLDEADQMLNIGFKQDIERIFKFISASTDQPIQCLMFSATIPDWIWQMSSQYQSKSVKFIDMIQDSNIKTSKTVEHFCMYSEDRDKEYCVGPLINYFLNQKKGKVIVFCETKRDVDRLGHSKRIPRTVAMLHGDYGQYERQKVFHDFKKGTLQCLIATNVAARGLDFPQIDLIIQMQPPSTTDAYIHRSGRTGRAGKSGICITLYSGSEEYLMGRIEKEAKVRFQHIEPKELWQEDSGMGDNESLSVNVHPNGGGFGKWNNNWIGGKTSTGNGAGKETGNGNGYSKGYGNGYGNNSYSNNTYGNSGYGNGSVNGGSGNGNGNGAVAVKGVWNRNLVNANNGNNNGNSSLNEKHEGKGDWENEILPQYRARY